MRRVHLGLVALIVIIFIIGYLETRPKLEGPEGPGKADTRGRVHISYWEKWGSFEADACQAMVDAFNASQDEITVHYLRTSEVDRKSMLAIIGGDPPDVVGLFGSNTTAFAEGGALLPLDDLMAKSGLTPDYYVTNYLRLGQHRGKTYALPTTPATTALVYNKEHFRQKAAELRAAGLDPDHPPRTIEELDRYAKVLTEFDENGSPRIMGFLPTEPGNFYWAYPLFFGGRWYDAETDTLTTDEPANVRAFLWAKRYAEQYGREKLMRFRDGFGNFDSPQNSFIDGKVSMEISGVWFPNFIRRHRPHMAFGIAPFPCAEGIPGPRSSITADTIAIPRGCKHPEEAWKFIHFVQTDGLPIICRLQGKHMPIRKVPPMFYEGHPNLELKVYEAVGASLYTRVDPPILIWRQYRDEIVEAFQHVWNWVPPEGEFEDLSGDARQKKIDELCEAEVKRTLAALKVRMRERLDRVERHDRMRRERDGS